MTSDTDEAVAQQSHRFPLPGFGLPLDFLPEAGREKEPNGVPRRGLFANALDINLEYPDGMGGTMPLTTLREFTMLHLMNEITEKPDWHTKIFDDEIAAKWRSEALSSEGRDITERMIDWCLAELRYKARIFEETHAISVYNGDVVKSDVAIPSSLRDALKSAVSPLEQIPEQQQDWHPGSDRKVLDLVHPSLFPLVYGRSRILRDKVVGLHDCIERSGEGETIPPVLSDPWSAELLATRFSQLQWLPCDVDISGGEGKVKIISYINNLHPGKHEELYAILEVIISRIIPLWNLSLTPVLQAQAQKELSKDDYCHPLPPSKALRIKYTAIKYDPDPESGPESEGPQPIEDESPYSDSYWERRERWYEETRKVVLPEPGIFEIPHAGNARNVGMGESVDIWRDYHNQGLQIIVKLANIHLTPEKPQYEGGTWHVEGKLNERICASAIYYYDSENITTSRLAFRHHCDTDGHEIGRTTRYQQWHYDWLPAVFGCEQGGPGVQIIGAVDTPEGRLLTWPNILQHQVQPFKLADPAKPGHRKILALFLVDPNIRIISTANIPCQQQQWWIDAIRQGHNRVSALPIELQDAIFQHVDEFPMTLREAKEVRLKLMEERKNFIAQQNEALRYETFSLCEH